MYRYRILVAGAVLLTAACASLVPPQSSELPPGVMVHATTDLADVERAAGELATALGADRVLVAFDLDNTLLTMRTDLGADQWYDWQSELGRDDPCSPALVADRLAIQGALFHVGAMMPTEPQIPQRIERLQKAGHPVMLVTARGADFRLATFRELRRNGLSFRASAPGAASGSGEPFELPGGKRPVLYEDGALLLAGQHKGNMLLALLDARGLDRPAAIVFVDDKDKNVAALHEVLEREGITGRLFRYDRLLERVNAFDPEQAARDWTRLRPALETVEQVMGEDNFDLPESSAAAVGCDP